jgi:His/Glu/Gln/Arg/opine family amino acid ABC transporter permease subunit
MRYADFTPYDLVLLLQGLGVSIGLFLATSLIGIFVGTLWAIVRFYRVPVLTPVIHFLAELLKNSPVLVQLFLVFFGFPAFFRLNVTPVEAAVITLSANTAAFVYVIAVSAIESIGRDQIEAARVFGLTRWQVLRHIVASQAAAFSAGPLVALMVNQLQVTSLVSVIGVMVVDMMCSILNFSKL